jgi:RNase H-fold protein (predicted Holliday junction resolvase)
MIDTVIAIDPGRGKCGLAVVNKNDGVLWKKVVAVAELPSWVEELMRSHAADTVVVGDRTAHQAVLKALEPLTVDGHPLCVHTVDEHHSSEEARGRYWRENPPRGIMRLIPVTMRTPPVPVDDFVAVILAERYFRRNVSTKY